MIKKSYKTPELKIISLMCNDIIADSLAESDFFDSLIHDSSAETDFFDGIMRG